MKKRIFSFFTKRPTVEDLQTSGVKVLLYLRYAKCGGTFLNTYFDEYYKNHIITILHIKPYKKDRYLSEFKDSFNKFFKFTFVRNPWSWQVSLYFHYRQSLQNPNRELFKNTFTSFKDWMINRQNHDSAKHFGGPFNWEQDLFKNICYYNNVFLPDYVGKIETMANDIKRIFEINQIKSIKAIEDFHNENKDVSKISNMSKHEHYSKYYTDDLIDLVYRENKEIIENFNYKFEDKR